ncbi:OmpW/AlkL family protein [Azorhizobium caulinodans]|uniref:OmpW/AlkL family protein n=1 Tax=Azorhizobium caulinodans TaxID=7 RepID=UPI002FBEC8DB
MAGFIKSFGSKLAGATALAGVAAIAFSTLGAAPAAAADLSLPVKAAPVVVDTWNPWQIRLRITGVVTNDSGHVNGVAGSGISTSDTVIPELDISYYFTKNWAAELILGTTYSYIDGTGSLNGTAVGKTWLLPPTLLLQYHFTDFGAFQPYVGAGVNYTIFYNQSANQVTSIDVKNTWGWALQAGFDYMIDRHWGWNVDVKKIFLEPDFNVTVGRTPLTGSTNLSPWLLSTGVTYRF